MIVNLFPFLFFSFTYGSLDAPFFFSDIFNLLFSYSKMSISLVELTILCLFLTFGWCITVQIVPETNITQNIGPKYSLLPNFDAFRVILACLWMFFDFYKQEGGLQSCPFLYYRWKLFSTYGYYLTVQIVPETNRA